MCVSLISFSVFKTRPGVLWKKPNDFIKFQRSAEWAEFSRFPWWRCKEQLNWGGEGKYSRGQQQPKALQLSPARSARCHLCCCAPALASPWDVFIVQAKVWKEVNCTKFFLRKWGSRRLNLSSRLGGFESFPALRNALEEPLSALLLTPAPGIKAKAAAAAAALGESLMDLLLHPRGRNGMAQEKTHK